MRFLHAADCHIDSPLRGLEKYEGAPVERVRYATRVAFQNLIKFALELKVDFLILAGDLFDGPWPDMQTGIWTNRQLIFLLYLTFIPGTHGKFRWPSLWPLW